MENPFKNQILKLRRTAKLTQILVKYGFQDLLGSQSDRPPMEGVSLPPDDPTVYARIRLAIEELGPTFVKFGQTLSSREDLLPAQLIVELKKLQDRVPPQDIDIVPYIEEQLGIDTSESFREIETAPIASASIAQVYKAVLADGTPVILKVKRPNIRTTIHSDLLILRDIVHFLSDYSLTIRQINLTYISMPFTKPWSKSCPSCMKPRISPSLSNIFGEWTRSAVCVPMGSYATTMCFACRGSMASRSPTRMGYWPMVSNSSTS